MLCNYEYRTIPCGTRGKYQADTEDVKKLFHHLRKSKRGLEWFAVELADGRYYYWDSRHGWEEGQYLKKYACIWGRNVDKHQWHKKIKLPEEI